MRLGLTLSAALLGLTAAATAQSPLLYDNGPIVTHPGGGAGGADVSALDNTATFHSPHNVYGFTGTGAFSLADDFTVCGTWSITDVEIFAYLTNSAPPLVTGVWAQVWDRDPRLAGATVIRGDNVTNLVTAPPIGTFNCYRTLIGGLAVTNRQVQTAKVAVNWAPLPPGTYWLHVRYTGTSFTPPVTENEVNDTGDGIQHSTTTGVWTALDNDPTAGFAGCAVPFRFYGTGTGTAAAASAYGAGKAGTNGVGAWDLGTPVRTPILGRAYPFRLTNGVSGSVPIVAVGVPVGGGLPFPPIGTLYVSPILATFAMPAFDASNRSTVRLNVPHGPNLCGVALGWQGFWGDAGAAGGIGHSDGLLLTLGN